MLRSSRMIVAKKSSVSLPHRQAEVVLEVGELLGVGLRRFERARLQPLPAELLDQRLATSDRAACAPTCASRTAWRAQLVRRREPPQLGVRHARPEEVREPRRQLVVATTAAAIRRGDGMPFQAEQEVRRDEHALQGQRRCPARTIRRACARRRTSLQIRLRPPAASPAGGTRAPRRLATIRGAQSGHVMAASVPADEDALVAPRATGRWSPACTARRSRGSSRARCSRAACPCALPRSACAPSRSARASRRAAA